ncbi:hypothetical protein N8927_02515 [Crocinitomicaceae bacterium]|nr:hypothetical protein [Crocinitomicaceae bacterium]
MRVRFPFKFICLVSIVLMFSVQGCSTVNSYSDSEVEDFEDVQKKQQGRMRVDSASKTRVVPKSHPTKSLINSKPKGGG